MLEVLDFIDLGRESLTPRECQVRETQQLGKHTTCRRAKIGLSRTWVQKRLAAGCAQGHCIQGHLWIHLWRCALESRTRRQTSVPFTPPVRRVLLRGRPWSTTRNSSSFRRSMLTSRMHGNQATWDMLGTSLLTWVLTPSNDPCFIYNRRLWKRLGRTLIEIQM